ncbi:MAG: YkgJ family cysteine cluster protein [Lachnospiraceae bacterium]|nr:YkgJ family cysteine cluster protein [Lachnospiraceae bacterium]
MKRQVSLEEISDGRLYDSNDMVKAGCGDCAGCSACCRGVGNTIILDPYDGFRLCGGLNKSFEELLAGAVELNMVDGTILPNLKMAGEQESCTFLDEAGRCSVHAYRPGICRLFPLGRYYENGGFQYFLQVNECRKENRTKVKVHKWLDTPDLKRYETYITNWHYFIEGIQQRIQGHVPGTMAEERTGTGDELPEETAAQREAFARNANLYILKLFYLTPYRQEEDFYPQFYERLRMAKKAL